MLPAIEFRPVPRRAARVLPFFNLLDTIACYMPLTRTLLAVAFGLILLYAGYQDPGPPSFSARLEVAIESRMPARVYIFKNDRSFKLQPVQAVLPVKSISSTVTGCGPTAIATPMSSR